MKVGAITGELLGRILALLGEDPKRTIAVHLEARQVTISTLHGIDVHHEHIAVEGPIVTAPTLGDRLDRLIYASHLAAANGDRHYENSLSVIENGIAVMEASLRGDR